MDAKFIPLSRAGEPVHINCTGRPGVYVTKLMHIVFVTPQMINQNSVPRTEGRLLTADYSISRANATKMAIAAGYPIPNTADDTGKICSPGAWLTPMNTLLRVTDKAFDEHGYLTVELDVSRRKGLFVLLHEDPEIDDMNARMMAMQELKGQAPNF